MNLVSGRWAGRGAPGCSARLLMSSPPPRPAPRMAAATMAPRKQPLRGVDAAAHPLCRFLQPPEGASAASGAGRWWSPSCSARTAGGPQAEGRMLPNSETQVERAAIFSRATIIHPFVGVPLCRGGRVGGRPPADTRCAVPGGANSTCPSSSSALLGTAAPFLRPTQARLGRPLTSWRRVVRRWFSGRIVKLRKKRARVAAAPGTPPAPHSALSAGFTHSTSAPGRTGRGGGCGAMPRSEGKGRRVAHGVARLFWRQP